MRTQALAGVLTRMYLAKLLLHFVIGVAFLSSIRLHGVAVHELVAFENQNLSRFIAYPTRSSRNNSHALLEGLLTSKYHVCIVGSGITGAVLAERYTSELRARVLVLDIHDPSIGPICNISRTPVLKSSLGLRQIEQEASLRNDKLLFSTNKSDVGDYIKNFGDWKDVSSGTQKKESGFDGFPKGGYRSIFQQMVSSPLLVFATVANSTIVPYGDIQHALEQQCDQIYLARTQNTTSISPDERVHLVSPPTVSQNNTIELAIEMGLDLFEQETGIRYRIGDSVHGSIVNVSTGRMVEKGLRSYAGELDDYVNSPPVQMTRKLQARIDKAMQLPIGTPLGLRHKAHPPGNDAIMGLAAYPENMKAWKTIVGSLRAKGYDGHFMFGVHQDIPREEEDYLQRMNVTYYTVELVECSQEAGFVRDNSQLQSGAERLRAVCPRGLDNLKLEWARFEMSRQWLHDCTECTGWALFTDTRDILFQKNVFESLPPPHTAPHELLFMEEISAHSNPRPEDPSRAFVLGESRMYKGWTSGCYGNRHWQPFYNRPMLCAGTVMGTRDGMMRFFSILVDEFHTSNTKANPGCQSPQSTDQGIMNYLYYTGRFGFFERTATIPWGMGPINTIGKPCVKDGQHSSMDLIPFDNTTESVLNIHELNNSSYRVAAALHQYDRCHLWIRPWMRKHSQALVPE